MDNESYDVSYDLPLIRSGNKTVGALFAVEGKCQEDAKVALKGFGLSSVVDVLFLTCVGSSTVATKDIVGLVTLDFFPIRD